MAFRARTKPTLASVKKQKFESADISNSGEDIAAWKRIQLALDQLACRSKKSQSRFYAIATILKYAHLPVCYRLLGRQVFRCRFKTNSKIVGHTPDELKNK